MMRNNRKDRTVPHVHARGIASRCVRRIRVAQWWNMRAVPDTRKEFSSSLNLMGERQAIPCAGGVRSEFDGSLLDAACFEGIILEVHKFFER